MNQRLLFLCFVLIISNISAQPRLVRVNASTPICAAMGDEVPKDRYADKASPEAQSTIKDICRKMGVSVVNFTIEAANVKNAEALVLYGRRYIHYNPLFINSIKEESKTYWSMVFVLAHEIGHHINGDSLKHADLEITKLEELAADKFAGCALAHLGASSYELQKAVNILSEAGDTEHPPRDARMVSAFSGWEDCAPNHDSDPNPIHKTTIAKKTSPKDCAKTTGDIYFKNTTKRPIRIHTSPQSGWYDQYHFITVDPGDTKGFLDLKVGRQTFAIRISSGGTSFEDYKNEEIRIEPCADESQQPVIIR